MLAHVTVSHLSKFGTNHPTDIFGDSKDSLEAFSTSKSYSCSRHFSHTPAPSGHLANSSTWHTRRTAAIVSINCRMFKVKLLLDLWTNCLPKPSIIVAIGALKRLLILTMKLQQNSTWWWKGSREGGAKEPSLPKSCYENRGCAGLQGSFIIPEILFKVQQCGFSSTTYLVFL